MWEFYSLNTQDKGCNDGILNDKDMVQRQLSVQGDARGSVRMGAGEADASVVPLKSQVVDFSSPEIVVNAIDARHVVDEIRDSSPADEILREENGLESLADLTQVTKDQLSIPRASWFDVFDWNNGIVGGSIDKKPSTIDKQPVVVAGEEVFDRSVGIEVDPSRNKNIVVQEEPIYSGSAQKKKLYPMIATTNSIVQSELQSVNISSVPKTGAEYFAPIDPPEQMKGVSGIPPKEDDLSLCAMVIEETIVEVDPEMKRQSATNTDAFDGTCSVCLCFRDDTLDASKNPIETVDQENVKMENGKINRDFLSSLFSCIDPVPPIKDEGDLLEEIEKTLTAEMVKEEKVDKTDSTPDAIIKVEPELAFPSVRTAPAHAIVVNAMTPALSNMICNKETDDGSADEQLLDKDLESVPSVKEDVRDAVPPMQSNDLGSPKAQNTNSAALVERKAMELKVPTIFRDEESMISNGTGLSSKITIDPSIDARRSLLVKELRSAISTFGRYDIRCANISAALGDLMEEAKDFDHAVKLHKDAGTIYSCKLGDDHATTLNAKMRLGSVLENSGRVEEAINNYYQVTVMQRALHGDQDPAVAEGLVRMAQALRKKGDYQPAIKELKRALKIYRDTLGDSHEKVSATVDEIASLYVIIGDFNKSAAILEEVVKLKAATTGMKSKAVASTLGNLATAYECSEKFDEAMKALKKSYKIYTETGGYSSEDSTTTLNRMAQLYEAMNDPNRAAVAYLGVLRGRKIQLGPDHLSVGETYFRLGHSLRETKQYDKALKCLKEALPIFVGQGVEMNDVKMVAEIMHEMALINEDRGHYQDAARIFKQELSVLRKIGQPEFPFAARTLKHLGITECHLKNFSRSLKYFVEALSIYQNHNDQGLECADVLVHSGFVFYKVDNKDRAKEVFQEAVRIYGNHKIRENYTLLQDAKEYIQLIDQGKSGK
jgi:tetratricopeptide (TPR) repeat protein